MNEVRILNKFCKKLKITESFFLFINIPHSYKTSKQTKKKKLIYFDCACCVSVVLLLTFL